MAPILNRRAATTMGFLTPIAARCSTFGRLSAFLLVVLIVSPFTAPFSVMSGTLEASPSGPADSIQGETMQAPAVVEDVAFLHAELALSLAVFPALEPEALAEFSPVNQILRL